MQCEHCHHNHDGNYGSGRFCSQKCARAFSTSHNRKIINEKIRQKLTRHVNSKIDTELLKKILPISTSWNHLSRFFNLRNSGSRITILRNAIKSLKLDVDQVTQHFRRVRTLNEILAVRPGELKGNLRNALIRTGRKYECEECFQKPIWNGKKLTLQVDHINGISHDHRQENLRFLCPNCHTQTSTFSWKNLRKK